LTVAYTSDLNPLPQALLKLGSRLTALYESVVSVRGVRLMGGKSAAHHRNLMGRDKNPGSTNKYTKFGQLIIRKIIKISATRCHIL